MKKPFRGGFAGLIHHFQLTPYPRNRKLLQKSRLTILTSKKRWMENCLRYLSFKAVLSSSSLCRKGMRVTKAIRCPDCFFARSRILSFHIAKLLRYQRRRETFCWFSVHILFQFLCIIDTHSQQTI